MGLALGIVGQILAGGIGNPPLRSRVGLLEPLGAAHEAKSFEQPTPGWLLLVRRAVDPRRRMRLRAARKLSGLDSVFVLADRREVLERRHARLTEGEVLRCPGQKSTLHRPRQAPFRGQRRR